MKTLETINGQKVWAVDATHGCDGCMFKDNPITNTCFQCCDDERPDKRNVIFQLYEEEKTFTLSQINEVIEEMIMKRNIQSDLGVKEYIKALKELQLKLEQL